MDESALNPYASPHGGPDQRQDVYYATATRQLSFREIRWQTGNLIGFIFASVFKILRINFPVVCGFGHPRFVRYHLLDELSSRARAELNNLIEQARQSGFELEFSYSLPTVGPIEGVGLVGVDRDRSTVIGIIHGRGSFNGNEIVQNKAFVGTYYPDGRAITTSLGSPDLIPLSNVETEYFQNQSLAFVLNRHRERTARRADRPISFATLEALAHHVRDRETANFEFHLARGVYFPMSVEQVERLRVGPKLPS